MSYFSEEVVHKLEESRFFYGAVNIQLNFLVDAQLPKTLSDFLKSKGHNSIHTLELPDKNATTDNFIKEKAYKENLILITKDDDFLHSFLIEKKPPKLILVKTGNISNIALMSIFDNRLTTITSLIKNHPLIEISKEEIIVHD